MSNIRKLRPAINKALNYPPIPHPYIEGINIIDTNRHIDRIQLSVKARFYDVVINGLEKSLCPLVQKYKYEKRQDIKKFRKKNIKINVIRYAGDRGHEAQWFVINLFDPDEECQKLINTILAVPISLDCSANRIVSLSQIEFAFDFYCTDRKDQRLLLEAIQHTAVLTGMREGAYRKLESTVYQGNKGNVRTGSKGLTIYDKRTKTSSIVRMELRLNRPFLLRNGMNVDLLPLSPDLIDIFDYVTFKKGIDSQGLNRTVTKIVNQRLKHWETKPSKIAQRTLRHCIQQSVVTALSAGNTGYPWCDPLDMKSVVEQRDYVKGLASKYCFDLYRCDLDI